MTQKNVHYLLYKILLVSNYNRFFFYFFNYPITYKINYLLLFYIFNLFYKKKLTNKKININNSLNNVTEYQINSSIATKTFLEYYNLNLDYSYKFFTLYCKCFYFSSKLFSSRQIEFFSNKNIKGLIKSIDSPKMSYSRYNLLYKNSLNINTEGTVKKNGVTILKLRKKKSQIQKFFKKKILVVSFYYFTLLENLFFNFVYNKLLRLKPISVNNFFLKNSELYKLHDRYIPQYKTINTAYSKILYQIPGTKKNIMNLFFHYVLVSNKYNLNFLNNVKNFTLESLFLINYFQLLINNIVSINFKYYRINYKRGVQPYGYRFVNRKRFFYLPIFELYDLYRILIILFKTMDINLLKIWIKKSFEKISYKKHKLLCYLLRFYLKRLFLVYRRYTLCTGFFLRIKGKIAVGGNSRKRSFIVKGGKRSFTQKNLKILYTDFFLLTQTGVLGVKFLFSFS